VFHSLVADPAIGNRTDLHQPTDVAVTKYSELARLASPQFTGIYHA
jgi:hypothetical protein